MKYDDKTILVTGGGSGIGRALALKFAALGGHVIICGRSFEALQQTAAGQDGRIEPVVADVTDPDGRARLAETLRRRGKGLDILINNAGIQRTIDLSDELAQSGSAKSIEEEVSINLTSAILLTFELLPMITRPRGVVVNITSVLAFHPKASAPVYCATKAGLSSFTRSLRYQTRKDQLLAVEVIPPLVQTQMTEGRGSGKIVPAQAAEEIIDGINRKKRRVWIGKAKAASVLNYLAPGLLARMMMRT